MTGNDIFELARTRQTLPDNARLSAQALYTTARNIYKAFSQKLISVEQAKQEKARAIQQYDTWERGEQIAHDYFRRTVALDQAFTNAVKGDCENCKKMFRIMTGLEPPGTEDT